MLAQNDVQRMQDVHRDSHVHKTIEGRVNCIAQKNYTKIMRVVAINLEFSLKFITGDQVFGANHLCYLRESEK